VWRERLLGVLGLAVVGFATMWIVHPTMVGMTQLFFQLPAGVATFSLLIVLLRHQPARRLRTAVLCSAVGFGVWDMLKMDGTTGKFSTEFSWRWAPTAEEEYLKQLAESGRRSNHDRDAAGRRGATDASAGAAATATVASGGASEVTRSSSEWPEFRGPNRDGHFPGVTLAADWTSQPPVVKWKTRVGPGWSSFAVAGRRLFTQEQRGDHEAVVCLDANSGATLWVHEYASRFWEAIAGAGPRATPTVGDAGLYCLGANGELLCLNAVTGKLVWQRKLQEEANRTPPPWGFASSPLLVGNLVVVHAGGPADKGVLAFDAKSGEPRWSVASGDHSYSSPHHATFSGVEGLLMATNRGLQFLDPATGVELWSHAWETQNYRAIQPLVDGDAVYLGTSLGGGTRRIAVSHSNGVWAAAEVWTSIVMKPDFNDFVQHDGHIYGFDGNIFACISMQDGRRLWKRGRYGNGQVLLLPDSGQLLVISEQGELVLIQADPTELQELCRFPAIDGKTWNHPVLIQNRLYLRNGKEAACIELRVRESPGGAAAASA
jgi:outer membrane protein assembly factor BamB